MWRRVSLFRPFPSLALVATFEPRRLGLFTVINGFEYILLSVLGSNHLRPSKYIAGYLQGLKRQPAINFFFVSCFAEMLEDDHLI